MTLPGDQRRTRRQARPIHAGRHWQKRVHSQSRQSHVEASSAPLPTNPKRESPGGIQTWAAGGPEALDNGLSCVQMPLVTWKFPFSVVRSLMSGARAPPAGAWKAPRRRTWKQLSPTTSSGDLLVTITEHCHGMCQIPRERCVSGPGSTAVPKPSHVERQTADFTNGAEGRVGQGGSTAPADPGVVWSRELLRASPHQYLTAARRHQQGGSSPASTRAKVGLLSMRDTFCLVT